MAAYINAGLLLGGIIIPVVTVLAVWICEALCCPLDDPFQTKDKEASRADTDYKPDKTENNPRFDEHGKPIKNSEADHDNGVEKDHTNLKAGNTTAERDEKSRNLMVDTGAVVAINAWDDDIVEESMPGKGPLTGDAENSNLFAVQETDENQRTNSGKKTRKKRHSIAKKIGRSRSKRIAPQDPFLEHHNIPRDIALEQQILETMEISTPSMENVLETIEIMATPKATRCTQTSRNNVRIGVDSTLEVYTSHTNHPDESAELVDLLEKKQVKFKERDLSEAQHFDVKDNLYERLGIHEADRTEGNTPRLPRVYLNDRYMGGLQEVQFLNENGDLNMDNLLMQDIMQRFSAQQLEKMYLRAKFSDDLEQLELATHAMDTPALQRANWERTKFAYYRRKLKTRSYFVRLQNHIRQLDVTEVKHYHHPPPAVKNVIQATLLLLNEDPGDDWNSQRQKLRTMGQSSITKRIENLDLHDISDDRIRKARRLLKGFTLPEVSAISRPLGAFFNWASDMVSQVDLNQRKAEMEALENENVL